MSKPEDDCKRPHVLLTSLGVRAFKMNYTWKGESATARLAPLALMELMKSTHYESPPDQVIAVVTSGVKESKSEYSNQSVWGIFQEEIKDIMCLDPVAVEVPDGHDADEIREILAKVARSVPENVDLTLDVTHGFRHFPFVFYALVLYLKSLRKVTIRGAYYGLYEGIPGPKPILDLQPLLNLPEWFYAVRMFRDHGTPLPIRDLIEPLAEPLKKALKDEASKLKDKDQSIALFKQSGSPEKAVDQLGRYAFAYGSALPLELGRAAEGLANPLKVFSAPQCQHLLPPLSDLVIKDIVDVADQFSIKKTGAKGEWKRKVVLDKCELDRQARMIDSYLDRGQIPLAVGLMREWVVSWMMWKVGTDREKENWVDESYRSPFEDRLGALSWFVRKPVGRVTAQQQKFGTFWGKLTNELRNAFHHHGMRSSEVSNPQGKSGGKLDDVRDFWGELRKQEVDPPRLGGSRGLLLVSPHGARRGALFMALKTSSPDRCLVICSKDSSKSISEVTTQACFPYEAMHQFMLNDHRSGFDEIDETAEFARRLLLEADEVVANSTGGTTLMGLIVQRWVEEAKKLKRPVRRFALVDRRSREEQDKEPYVEGELYWLDKSR